MRMMVVVSRFGRMGRGCGGVLLSGGEGESDNGIDDWTPWLEQEH